MPAPRSKNGKFSKDRKGKRNTQSLLFRRKRFCRFTVAGVEQIDYKDVDTLRDFTLAEHAPKITCPTLVCSADGDDISASAGQLTQALTCPHEHLRFTAADGAADHCEAGARVLYHTLTFDWLDRQLQPHLS